MRICMILEGCYPYVRGGVSTWMHNYILGMPQHEFVLWLIGAESKNRGKYKYDLPKNVVEVREVFLDDAMQIPVEKNSKLKLTKSETEEHKKLMEDGNPNWDVLFRAYNLNEMNVNAFLMSEDYLNILLDMSRKEYPYVAFSELFYTMRSILLPMLYLMSQKIPQADVYHSSCSGYAGLIGSMASRLTNKPYILTEHGIYSREREEEILRSNWVPSYFKRLWIQYFYALAKVAYQTAASVTALYGRANQMQTELGCDPRKEKFIFNGINTATFDNVQPKVPDGWIDIGAIVRFHPIKDIKTMIYSFAELKSRFKNARLHIMGDVDDQQYKDECVELISQLDVPDIIITGPVNVSEYLNRIDFTILTSISEGQPLAVLESMASARPCVTTDVGCCRELLTGDTIDDLGRAGFIVKPMYAQATANAMEFLCTHDEERIQMGEIGRRRVRESFRHEDIIKKYENNYWEVLKLWQGLALN